MHYQLSFLIIFHLLTLSLSYGNYKETVPTFDPYFKTQFNSSNITCNANNKCFNQTWSCLDNELECNISCIGSDVCKETHFICPHNANSKCNILCDQGCSFATIDASLTGRLNVFAINSYGIYSGNIICPNNGDCNILCNGYRSCKQTKINAIDSHKLNISASGFAALYDSDIWCPKISTSNDPLDTNCSIMANGANDYMVGWMSIYSKHSLNGVYFSCNGVSHDDCFHNLYPPKMYCNGDTYNDSCELAIVDYQNDPDLWICRDGPLSSMCYISPYIDSIDTTNSTIDCGQDRYFCTGHELFCSHGADCDLYCDNAGTCDYVIIHCPMGYSCNIHCDGTEYDEENGCRQMTINATYSTHLSIFASNEDELMFDTKIYCPNDGTCYIMLGKVDDASTSIGSHMTIYSGTHSDLTIYCHGYFACINNDIYLSEQTNLFLDCNGKWSCKYIDINYAISNADMDANIKVMATGDNVLYEADIRCPDMYSNAFSTTCSIYVYGDGIKMLANSQIFAYNSFDDIDLVCNYTYSYTYNCAERQSNDVTNLPLIGCTAYTGTDDNALHSCTYQLMTGINDWECVDVTSPCSVTKRTEYESIAIVSDTFICNGYKECFAGLYHCVDNSNCSILCSGEQSCGYATFKCPSSANRCELIIAGSNADFMTIDATDSDGGTLIILSDTNQDALDTPWANGTVYCPNHGDCNVTCIGNRACKWVDVISQEWTRLFVSAPNGGAKVLDGMNIHCPTNHVPGFNNDCYVIVAGNDLWMLDEVKFYTIESLYDIYISCEYGSDGMYQDCFTGLETTTNEYLWPRMYCGEHYVSMCDLDLKHNTTDQFFCRDSSNYCSLDTLTKLPAPTTSNTSTSDPPTTSIPTTGNPTTYKPTTDDPTTPDPTTTVPTTSDPATAAPTTEKPTTSPPTPKQATNNVTITIDGDTTDLEEEQIIAIITKSLNISSDDIISTKIEDGSIIILISIPSNIRLSDDKIKTNVEDGLVDEYGDDLDISVSVTQTDNKKTENTEHPLSILISDIKILILIIVMTILIIICCILLIAFYCKKKKENKLIQASNGKNADIVMARIISKSDMSVDEINVNEGQSSPPQIAPVTIIGAGITRGNDKKIEYNMDCHDDVEIVGDGETIGAQHGERENRIDDIDVVEDINKTNIIYGDDVDMDVVNEINKTKGVANNVENDEVVIGDDEITKGMDDNNLIHEGNTFG